MKHSIKKIFKNLSNFLMLVVILTAFGVLAAVEHSTSYAKVENLNNQKSIINSLMILPKENLELALIEFKGKSAQLLHNIDKLRNQYGFSFVEKYILSNEEEYLADLDKLSSLAKEFNMTAIKHYTEEENDNQEKKEELLKSFNSVFEQINTMIFKSISYNKAKFNIYKNITYLVFIILLLAAIIYRKKLNSIYKDIEYLHDVDKKGYEIFTQEAGAIAIRMRRKPDISENPAMIDPLTGINNIKGMMNSYAEKKNLKEKTTHP